jgi:hypothetical protein
MYDLTVIFDRLVELVGKENLYTGTPGVYECLELTMVKRDHEAAFRLLHDHLTQLYLPDKSIHWQIRLVDFPCGAFVFDEEGWRRRCAQFFGDACADESWEPCNSGVPFHCMSELESPCVLNAYFSKHCLKLVF